MCFRTILDYFQEQNLFENSNIKNQFSRLILDQDIDKEHDVHCEIKSYKFKFF